MDKVSVEASSASHLKENLRIVPICSNIVFYCHKLFDLNLPFVFNFLLLEICSFFQLIPI